MKKFFIPFNGYGKDKVVKWVSIIIIPVLIWIILPNHTFPPITDILGAYPTLIKQNDLIPNLIISLAFCLKCMLYSMIIAFGFMIIARIPIFENFCQLCRKFRFLPSAGLSFLFLKFTKDSTTLMTWMMVWGITTFLLDSAIALALSVTKDDILYAKSLRLSNWKVFRELIILGKLLPFFLAVIQNFAIAWMLLATVENIVKSSGGIGVVLAESSKYFKLEALYAIQLVILVVGILFDYIFNLLIRIFFPYYTIKIGK